MSMVSVSRRAGPPHCGQVRVQERLVRDQRRLPGRRELRVQRQHRPATALRAPAPCRSRRNRRPESACPSSAGGRSASRAGGIDLALRHGPRSASQAMTSGSSLRHQLAGHRPGVHQACQRRGSASVMVAGSRSARRPAARRRGSADRRRGRTRSRADRRTAPP